MSCLLDFFHIVILIFHLTTLKLYKAFQTPVQTAMIGKVMIKLRSKFKFQILLQFYRTVEKVETCAGNGQMFHHLFNLPILVTILFFS